VIILLLIAAWFLVGALPKMRSDAADRLPEIRRGARANMAAHSGASRKAGRRKSAEWYGWAGTAVAAETAAVLGYMGRSAWRGWGDHRRRATAAVQVYRQKRADRAAAAEPTEPGTVPPDGLPPVPPGTGNRAADPDDDWDSGWDEPLPGDPRLDPDSPFRRPAPSPAAPNNRGDRPMSVATEAPNLETAVHVADALKDACTKEVDEAATELLAARAAQVRADSFGASLASAGVGGGVVEALASFADGTSARVSAAEKRVASADSGLAAATKARDDLRKHEAAADSLAATGGAADETRWYGATPGESAGTVWNAS
jgi:hypothetical protein